MLTYEELFSFDRLMAAHKKARLGKRTNSEVIEFELDLAGNLVRLQQHLLDGTYRQRGYYHFTIHDPKVREIYALHYVDRIVQHCLCDNLLAPWFEAHVIYDNAACRKHKGTHFALDRMDAFLHAHYRRYGTAGYILKCDIRKYFDNIDHEVLRGKLFGIFREERVRRLLSDIIDSYAVTPGKSIPLGNQTSQWFALWYLNDLDRYVKEERRIRHYTRYMDDFVLIHPDKAYLQETRAGIEGILRARPCLQRKDAGLSPASWCGIPRLALHADGDRPGHPPPAPQQQDPHAAPPAPPVARLCRRPHRDR